MIADLVGDNVGDCAARGADLFESIAAEIIAAMILGGTMAKKACLCSWTCCIANRPDTEEHACSGSCLSQTWQGS